MINITARVEGSFISTTASGYTFAVSNCIFNCHTSWPLATVTSNLGSSTTNYGSLFSLANAGSITSTANTF